DAGTPGLADPGYHLVRGALAAGVPVVPIPGPSALTALVSIAGLPADRFLFEGFLPTRTGARAARLAALAGEPRALVFFEAARRVGRGGISTGVPSCSRGSSGEASGEEMTSASTMRPRRRLPTRPSALRSGGPTRAAAASTW